jgi:hypothetical protein
VLELGEISNILKKRIITKVFSNKIVKIDDISEIEQCAKGHSTKIQMDPENSKMASSAVGL